MQPRPGIRIGTKVTAWICALLLLATFFALIGAKVRIWSDHRTDFEWLARSMPAWQAGFSVVIVNSIPAWPILALILALGVVLKERWVDAGVSTRLNHLAILTVLGLGCAAFVGNYWLAQRMVDCPLQTVAIRWVVDAICFPVILLKFPDLWKYVIYR